MCKITKDLEINFVFAFSPLMFVLFVYLCNSTNSDTHSNFGFADETDLRWPSNWSKLEINPYPSLLNRCTKNFLALGNENVK